MSRTDRFKLQIQYVFGRLAVFFIGPIVYLCVKLFGYRIRDLKAIRRECLALYKEHPGPWIICANHLTNIDSVILAYALAPLYRYVLHFSLLPWNLPERANFQRNLLSTAVCYLAKCIPVSRGGEREEMKRVLEKCLYLLREKQHILIFPEGGRSRTGRVNTLSFSYGVGRFVSASENSRILCIYMRGDGQDQYSAIPRLGERFTIALDVFKPGFSDHSGLRAQRHYAEQIINNLAKMEERYFAARRQRHSGLTTSPCDKKEPEYTVPETRISS